MEHIILFAISTVIMHLGLPFASTSGPSPIEDSIDAALQHAFR